MQQVKSKQRVADHGEVFTNEREVKAMVDLVWREFSTDEQKISKTFLEPACGSGNFLVEILERKLNTIKELDKKYKNQNLFQKNIITALASIYGVELLEDNTQECRERLYALTLQHYPKKYHESSHYPQMLENITYILSRNIICGNALDYTTAEGLPILFTDWAFVPSSDKVQCNYFDFKMIKDGGLYRDLAYGDREIPPVHYLSLHTLKGKEPKAVKETLMQPQKKISKPKKPKAEPDATQLSLF